MTLPPMHADELVARYCTAFNVNDICAMTEIGMMGNVDPAVADEVKRHLHEYKDEQRENNRLRPGHEFDNYGDDEDDPGFPSNWLKNEESPSVDEPQYHVESLKAEDCTARKLEELLNRNASWEWKLVQILPPDSQCPETRVIFVQYSSAMDLPF